jgi:hypothetical protein
MADTDKLTKKILAFRDARDWKQFHNPKDLALAINVEAGELLEQFLWKEAGEANPEKVKVYYTVCIPDIKNVATDSFRVSVKIPATFTPSATNISKVTIKHSPAWVKILRIEPENVEYTIKK